MASSKDARTEQEILDEMNALSVQDDESVHTTSSSESEDEEEDDKKSVGQPVRKDGNDDDDDPNDPDAAGSAETPPSIVLPALEAQIWFEDEALKEMMHEAETEDEVKKVIDYALQKARYYVNIFNDYKKKMKQLKKEGRKEKAKQLKKELEEIKKQKSKEERETVIVLKIKFNEVIFPVKITKAETIKGVAEELARMAKVKKSDVKRIRIYFGDKDLREHSRMSVTGAKLSDGDSLTAMIRARGGGKRAKHSTQDANEEIEVMFAPEPRADDIQAVLSAIKLREVSIKGWISTLSHEDAGRLIELMDEQVSTGKLSSLISPYMNFVQEHKKLTVRNLFFSEAQV